MVDRNTPDPSGLLAFVDQMVVALAKRLYLPALTVALTLPDMCAALEDPHGATSGAKYQAWLSANLAFYADKAEALYHFRCSLLHQGYGQHDKTGLRVLFLPPGTPLSNNKLSLSVTTQRPDGSTEEGFAFSIQTFIGDIDR